MTLREQLERRECELLSPHAALACQSKGRLKPEGEHDYRTCFQRDRDRILHAKAFRRLMQKTQVFLAPEGAHYRTRLTHTLEVSQIARSAARALFLNEDLVEAIALAHDLGHTPFGHAGERVLNRLFQPGFHHAEQSLRIVDHLESRPKGRGLNLTHEVRDGILNHSKAKVLFKGGDPAGPATLEGRLVAICDAIAYINHDIDDAIRGGVITLADLPQDAIRTLGATSSERINRMVIALIEGSQDGRIGMTSEVREATRVIRAHLYQHLYPSEPITREIRKAEKIVQELYEHFIEHPSAESAAGNPEDSIERRTVDFIAGMTDQYALQLYTRIFFPVRWPV